MKNRLLSYATVALAGLMFLSSTATAQVPVTASAPDIAITSGAATDTRSVNCDMLFNIHISGLSGQLRAIAYDDYSTSNSYLDLTDYTGANVQVFIPGALDIDVALGDDMSNLGTDYIAMVVYNSGIAPMIERFLITGVGSGTLSATSLGASFLPWVTGGPSQQPPHIDMYPDPNILTPIINTPSLHEYAVTWTEFSGGTDAYLTHADNSGFAFTPPYTISMGNSGHWPDVACIWDMGAGQPFAYVPVINGNDINLWEVNLATGANGYIASGINAGVTTQTVRIDAMSMYPGPSQQKYQVAYAEYAAVGNVFRDMISYNDLTGNTNLSAAGAGLGSGDNIHPAVAGGMGTAWLNGYGNENHTVAWYNTGNPFYYAQAIEAANGNVNPAFPDFYEVNQTPAPGLTLTHFAPIAVSTSNNWSGNELLTAWTNNNDVYYKYQGDVTQYKPTSVRTLTSNAYKLYPNPASNMLHVESKGNAIYTLTDITGRTLLKGQLTSGSNTIAVDQLAKGMYVISVTENSTTTSLKFAKD